MSSGTNLKMGSNNDYKKRVENICPPSMLSRTNDDGAIIIALREWVGGGVTFGENNFTKH